mmetsp:Transcript_12932/g.32582  ORF Transcript_12932/g.32582 Transcript_12932/m.32582 type:complete len:230 (+) Transcript_12932:130-819(+)
MGVSVFLFSRGIHEAHEAGAVVRIGNRPLSASQSWVLLGGSPTDLDFERQIDNSHQYVARKLCTVLLDKVGEKLIGHLRQVNDGVELLHDKALVQVLFLEDAPEGLELCGVLLVVVMLGGVEEGVSSRNLEAVTPLVLDELDDELDKYGVENGLQLLAVDLLAVEDESPEPLVAVGIGRRGVLNVPKHAVIVGYAELQEAQVVLLEDVLPTVVGEGLLLRRHEAVADEP